MLIVPGKAQLETGRTVIWGKAVLELHPFGWRIGDRETDTSEQAAAVLRVLWRADGHITSVSVANDGTVLVDVLVPTAGLDLNALQQRLQAVANSAMVEHVRAAR